MILKWNFLVIVVLFFSCKKDNTVDIRDKYVGRYSGIEIYIDYQSKTQDTTSVEIFLKKINQDTISMLELDLPNTDQKYYYDIIKDSLIFHGYFYHCPIITIRKDTLECDWTPSLAPRLFKYRVVKVK